jgi:hypothetical protein
MPTIRIVPYASPESRELLAVLVAQLYGPNLFCRAN